MNVILSHPQKAKLKFFAAYACSIVLLFVIFSFLRQNPPSSAVDDELRDAAADKEKIIQADLFLHKQLQSFDKLNAASQPNSAVFVANVQTTAQAFNSSMDSLANAADNFRTVNAKPTLQKLLLYFKSNVQSRADLVKNYAQLQHSAVKTDAVQSNASAPVNNALVAALQAQLRQKDEQIAAMQKQQQAALSVKDNTIRALQGQVNNGASPAAAATGDGEWKQKYSTIKSRYSELNTAYNALSSSYQSVVADNRRLLSQLERERNH